MLEHICPVCGYPELDEPAYNEHGDESFDICNSCGFQFGYSDGGVGLEDPTCKVMHKDWREKWISDGMQFYSDFRKAPVNWNPVRQLLNIGIIVKNGGDL